MAHNIFQGGTDAVRKLNRLTLRLLGLVGRVRPDERRDTLGALGALFAFMTGHALLETARDALFLAALPARQLPWIYLIIAVVALFIGRSESRFSQRMSGGNPLKWMLPAVAVVTMGFWLLVDTAWPGVFHALYIWSGVLATLVVVRFWTVVGSRFTLTQAKRIFPVIASGSVAGAIAGSALARGFTSVGDPRHLVLAAGVMFLLAGAVPMGAAAPAGPPLHAGEEEKLGRVARMIWAGPYLKRVTALVLLAAVTFTLVDFVFKSAADRFVAPQDLGEFFATVYLSVNLLSLFVQVFVVAWLLRHVGLVTVVAVVPAVMLLSTVGFAVAGGITFALVLKGADGTLRHSLHRTGAELLFVPLSERLRTQVKGFIDVLGQRGGQALASIVILMVLSTTANESVFAGVACLTAAAWLVVAVSLKEHYLGLFRETLYSHSEDAEQKDPELDLASLETLLESLNASDDRRVVAAVDVLADQGKIDVVPGLLLYHPSPTVVKRALDAFTLGGREDALPMVSRLLSHEDSEVRVAALRAVAVLGPDRDALEAAAADGDAGVSVTAKVMLVVNGWGDADSVVTALGRLEDEGNVAGLRSLAAALRVRPDPALEPVVRALLGHDDPAVLSDAIRAARELRTAPLVPALVQALGRRAVRDEARMALAAFGAPGIGPLTAALRDPGIPSAVRRHVPGALALVGSAQVPTILLQHLQDETDGMIRFKVLRALGRWRREQPSLPLDIGLLQKALGQALSAGFHLMRWRHGLESAAAVAPALRTELHEVLVALLRDKQDHALERIFRLLNLQAGSEEFHRVYRGVHAADATVRAGSRELLHHMILPPVRKELMTLVDDLHGEVAQGAEEVPARGGAHRGYERVLAQLVDCGMESASSLAALHAAELGLAGAVESIRATDPLSAEHRRALNRAADILTEGVA